MFHLQILFMAFRGLRQNLVRSLLATLGVIIGVGAVVSAVSILEGAQRDILDRFESLGADQVLVFNGQDKRGSRRTQMSSLVRDDVNRVAEENADVIVAVAPQFTGGGQIKYYERNVYCSVLGTTETYAPM